MNKKILKDVLQWDVRSWSKAIKYFEKKIDWHNFSNALELGAREGGLSLWIALKNIDIICSDLKDSKKNAYKLHSKYQIEDKITYKDIDAINIDYENYFDIIIFKSIIGGIGRNNNFNNQKKVFQEIHKALKPGGKLLFVENLIASKLHRIFREKFIKWGKSWRYINIEELKACLAIFSDFEIKTSGFLAVFGRNNFQRNILSIIDDLIFNKIFPDKWKYIAYGIATK